MIRLAALSSALKRLAMSVAVMCLLLPALALAERPQAHPKLPSRITRPIDDADVVELEGNTRPLPRSFTDAGVAAGDLTLNRMILVLKRSDAQEKDLKALLDAVKNPNSPSFHQWLTPEQFGARFGFAPDDESKIQSWLISHGFSVEPAAKSHDAIIFSGSNAQLQAAFHTGLHTYQSKLPGGSTVYANASNPSIPTALAGTVAGIARLSSMPIASQHKNVGVLSKKRGDKQWTASRSLANPRFNTTFNNSDFSAVGPSDLATIYNVQPLWDASIDGTGQTLALVGRSDINPADVDAFRSFFGLPAKKLNLIYDGPNPGLVPGDEGEADLDVEWSGAVAKNATIDLIVAGSTNTTDGIFLSAQYIVDNNLAPVMSMSFGECELGVGTTANQFIDQLWQQAAAQGITAMVSTGDSGSAGCDQDKSYAEFGLTVNGLASTPYNVAVGGTDLYGTYTAHSKYWSDTNDPTNNRSALSYMPELPWNNSCANPQLLAAFQQSGGQDQTLEAFCNDSAEQQYFLDTSGGSGGPSSCIQSSGGFPGSCTGGYPKPSWQSTVPGNPADNVRDIPDVSLFAGNGLWGALYVFCESDATDSGQCDFNSGDDVQYLAAGGTSFAAPAFAGIMSLVNQKTGSAQGNANIDLYKLASTQFSGSSAAACDSSTADGSGSCVFYDVSQGSNAVPCFVGTPNCKVTDPVDDYFGVLAGWDATPGYDTAVGLGSVNVANLVNSWSTATATLTATTTALELSAATATYGTPLSGTITVASSAAGIPDGEVALVSTSTTDTFGRGPFLLENGSATITANNLVPGAYTVAGHYGGDATFSSSTSTSISVTIARAATSATLSTSKSSITSGESDTFLVVLSSGSKADSPTGTVTFTNPATGALIGQVPVVSGVAEDGTSSASASVTLTATQLRIGNNTVAATYSGDGNYLASTASSVSVTLLPLFQIGAASQTVTVTAGSTASVDITLGSNGGPLPSAVLLSCPAPVPAGLTCTFSPPVIAAGSTTGNTTLTIGASFPMASLSPSVRPNGMGRLGVLGGSGLTATLSICFILFPSRKRRLLAQRTSGVVLMCLVVLSGCAGADTPVSTTTTLSVSGASEAQNQPVVFTAKVTASHETGMPTGTVTFTSRNATLGTSAVTNGSATLSTTSLPYGSNSVIASYSGDGKYLPSVSATPGVTDVEYITTLNLTATDSLGNTSSIQVTVSVK